MKKSKLLDLIIREYVKSREPIGSESLKCHFGCSSATIRNYCKSLEKDGLVSQIHVSSGRVPTVASLRRYWRENLKYLKDSVLSVDSKKIESCSREHRVYCVAQSKKCNILERVVVADNKYIILHFSRGEAVVLYSAAVHRFVSDLVSSDLDLVFSFATKVCASDLARKVLALKHVQDGLFVFRFGSDFLSGMLKENSAVVHDLLSAKDLLVRDAGVHFDIVPENYVAIVCDILHDDECAKMLCVGDVTNDYEFFFRDISA